MKAVHGDILSLKPSQKSALEKLYHRRIPAEEVLNYDTAKHIAKIVAELGRQVALLVGRDGYVTHVVVGTKDRTYLPDLGRFRLDQARLRRLRLIVFSPETERLMASFKPRPLMLGEEQDLPRRAIVAPEIAADFLTDLEKLRLDLVDLVAVTPQGLPGAFTLAYLYPEQEVVGRFKSEAVTTIAFYHGRDVADLNLSYLQFIEELERKFAPVSDNRKEGAGERALLVGAYTSSRAAAESSMLELHELARTAGVQIADQIIQLRKSLDPRTVVGSGKIEEIVLHSLDKGADLLIFDRELSPGQLRSITNMTELRVLDRSMLILDIFAQRAKSAEGKLQVELAQLRYSLPRLSEHDSGLSRLTGGIGGRGPGETKLEIGRRRARDRINDLEKKIKEVSKQRSLRRERRQSRGVPVVALVGYTNAGKSTLLNALTKSDVFVENKLFATLDTSTRRMRFPNEKEVVFVDTVGFIRELPQELKQAFRATLEEIGEADLLLHVVDSGDANMEEQIDVVVETLKTLEFDKKPRILVLNKIDTISALEQGTITRHREALAVSAVQRVGLEELIARVQEELLETFAGRDPGYFLEVS